VLAPQALEDDVDLFHGREVPTYGSPHVTDGRPELCGVSLSRYLIVTLHGIMMSPRLLCAISSSRPVGVDGEYLHYRIAEATSGGSTARPVDSDLAAFYGRGTLVISSAPSARFNPGAISSNIVQFLQPQILPFAFAQQTLRDLGG